MDDEVILALTAGKPPRERKTEGLLAGSTIHSLAETMMPIDRSTPIYDQGPHEIKSPTT
jgi:hypothetical protein